MRTISIIGVFAGLAGLAIPWIGAPSSHTFIDVLLGVGIAGNTYFATRQQ